MSFVRFGEDGSDVYVYECKTGLECCACQLRKDWIHPTYSAMLDHLGEHRKAGHRVPQDVFDELRKCQAADGGDL